MTLTIGSPVKIENWLNMTYADAVITGTSVEGYAPDDQFPLGHCAVVYDLVVEDGTVLEKFPYIGLGDGLGMRHDVAQALQG